MSKSIYILKQEILVIKNVMKVFIIKSTSQFMASISFFCMFFYYCYSLIKDNFSNATLGNNANMLIFIKTIYSSFGLILVLLCFSIMLIAYKNLIDNWNKLKSNSITTDQIFIASIILNLIIIGSIFIFFILSIAHVMNVNFGLTTVFVFLFYLLLIGDLLFVLSVYKIINMFYRSKLMFYFTLVITLGLVYYINLYFFNSKSFQVVNLIDYAIIFIPLFLGSLLYIIFSNKPMKLESSNKSKHNNLCTKFFMRSLNPYIEILGVEFYRNIAYYLELLLIPYLVLVIIRFLELNIDYKSLIPMLSLASSLPMGFYYSYISTYKALPIKNLYNTLSRMAFSILIVTLNYTLFIFFYNDAIKFQNYFECILNTILIFNIVNILKIPVVKYGKDNVLFYIIIFLIPAIYQISFWVFKNILNIYLNFNFSSNLILVTLNLILVIYSLIIGESEKNAIL